MRISRVVRWNLSIEDDRGRRERHRRGAEVNDITSSIEAFQRRMLVSAVVPKNTSGRLLWNWQRVRDGGKKSNFHREYLLASEVLVKNF